MTKKQLTFTEQTTQDQATREQDALRNLDRLAIVAGRLADLYIYAHDAIQRQERPRTGDTMGIRGSDVSDPTLAAVTAAWHTSQARDGWCTAILSVLAGAQELERSLTAVTRRADAHELAQAKDAARCTGGEGQPGGLVWGRPDCRELVVHLGPRLCTACYARRRRWEQAGRPDERRPHGGPRLPALPVDHGAIAGAYRLVAEFENVREAS